LKLWLKLTLAIAVVVFSFTVSAQFATISGNLTNRKTGEKLPYVTVRVLNTGKATSTNTDGSYRLVLQPGSYQLKFTHIGYYSQSVDLQLSDSSIVVDTSLVPTIIIAPGQVVYDRQYSRAQEIILEAIRRKQEILHRLGRYSYDAYTKAVVRDLSNPDSVKIMLITETQSESYWEQPDKYKEIITARRQSANVDPTQNLISLGELLNFNANRLEMGKYEVVSPVAEDALDFYDYYLLDSTYVDNNKVYRLEVDPKNDADPLVKGELLIADSTFDVVGVDGTFNQGVRMPFVSKLHYQQTYAQFEGQYWMPVTIAFSAEVNVDFPGVPNPMGFDLTASIHDYSFEKKSAPVKFDEYVLEVARSADNYDSTAWQQRQITPLTLDERRGYERLDSLEHAPRPIGRTLAFAGMGVMFLLTQPAGEDWFHFNRVEGAYTGLKLNLEHSVPNTDIWLKGGYAWDSKLPQYKVAGRYNVPGRARFSFGGEYLREVTRWKTLTGSDYNPTMEALFFKTDPLNYYERRGLTAYASVSPVRHVMLHTSVNDHRYRSLSVSTNYSMFGGPQPYRGNPNITDGWIRSGKAVLQYDSRMLWNNKGRISTYRAEQYTLFSVGAEVSSPDILGSDFNYRRYWTSLYRRQRTLGMGITQLWLFAGTATGELPAQSYYNYAFFDGEPIDETSRFQTLGPNYFSGNRTAYLYLRHDFDQYLFKKSGIPLVRDIPFTLNIYGGAMLAEFNNHPFNAGDEKLLNTRSPYTEIGFGLGNLTPFLGIFNLGAYFTWQLSNYDTRDFALRVGFNF
jgi:hypothetical protein